jgi:hypothetical protein
MTTTAARYRIGRRFERGARTVRHALRAPCTSTRKVHASNPFGFVPGSEPECQWPARTRRDACQKPPVSTVVSRRDPAPGCGTRSRGTFHDVAHRRWGCLIPLLLILLIAHTGTAKAVADEWSVFGYAGQWSANRIGAILRGETEFTSSYVAVAGGSRTLHRFGAPMSLELEINAGTHTGMQHHAELNTALIVRWGRFPWDRIADTSVAYGLGVSYAFRTPEIEQHPDRPPSRLLVFMPVEITFAPPRAPEWQLLVRVHHRSGAFGVISDARGSNFVTAGVRYRFSGQAGPNP